ncbi:glutamate-gated chloride channel subunit beta-like isoform X2 [Dermacentor silvarum]|uniref:glutamate-gated chloride channel subunit beta-like isoform X2 n=1 Tax=Dermacentor silvarum TaxID=543639 RepID=UPI002100A457|nr:glutamate-gated chloride channel subunit beta-like isoform X2 [Dermacentor silvarum]
MGTGVERSDKVVTTPSKRGPLRATSARGRFPVGLDGWTERCASRADPRAVECYGRASSASRLLLLLLTLLRDCAAFSAEEAALYTQVVGSRYSKSSPPQTADNKTEVFIQLEVFFVGDIREVALGGFELHAWVSLLWRDSRVNTELMRQLGHRIMPEFLARSVWRPSVVFESVGEVARWDEPDVFVRDDDFLLSRQRTVFKVLCLGQQDNFLLGVTVCTLVVKLLHEADSVPSLVWVGNDTASPLRGQYDSVTVHGDVRPLVYTLVKVEPVQRDDASAVGGAPAVTWSFLLSTYVPSTMVVVVSWIAFWMDVGAAACRVTLGVACLLMLVAQVGHNRIASPHATQLQPGDVWFFVSAVAVFCSLLEFVVAHAAYRDQARAQSVGVTGASASAVAEPRYRVYRKPPTMSTLTIVCDAASQTERSYRAYRANELDVLARVIFPIAFVLVASIYFLWYAASYE